MFISALQIEKQKQPTSCWAAAALCVLHYYGIHSADEFCGFPLTQEYLAYKYPDWAAGTGGHVDMVLDDFQAFDYRYKLTGGTAIFTINSGVTLLVGSRWDCRLRCTSQVPSILPTGIAWWFVVCASAL